MSAQTNVDLSQLPDEPERATLEGRNKILGFWLFLGAEVILFGTLFATFLALRHQVMDGPSPNELFDLGLVALATGILLVSSLFSVMAVQAMHRKDVKKMQFWLFMTFLFGFAFLCLEIYEFNHYSSMGHTFNKSAFSSAFYALVGFHGAHVVVGITWIMTLILQITRKGLNEVTAPKVYVASLYWHFVDVVWVFVFTVVYLMGKVG